MSIDRLSALDRFMLRVSRTWPQDIGALVILDGTSLIDRGGRFRLEAARAAIEARLDRFPRSRQIVHVPGRGLGPPLWVDAREFEVRAHVRELPLERPAGEAQLLAAVEDLRRQPMDPSRPMWQMWFLTGLPDRRIGWFVRIHHTLADGMAVMTAIASMLDTDPSAFAVLARPWRAAALPSTRALVMDNARRHARWLAAELARLARPRTLVRGAMAAWPGIMELIAERPATRTSLDRMVGRGRKLALIRSSLSTFTAIGRTYGGTVNDVLLAVTAGGLRALLRSRGEVVEDTTIRIYVPVSLRRGLRGTPGGNLIGQMAVPLRLGEPDPGRRLRQIVAETTRRKAKLRTSLGTLMHGGGIARRLMLFAVIRQRVNVTSASIPGPAHPLHLAGARILEVYPVLPLVANEPLGVGAVSYAGTLSVGVTADRDAFPDLEVLAAAMRDELRLLAAEAGVSPADHGAPARVSTGLVDVTA